MERRIRRCPIPVVFQLQFRFSTEATLVTKLAIADFDWRGVRIRIRQVPGQQIVGALPLQGYNHPITAVSGMALGTLSPTIASGEMFAAVRQALESPKPLLSNMRFVPAIRGFARGTYPLGSELQDVLVSASGLSAQEEDTITALAYSPREVEQVSAWMNQVTGVGLKTDLVPPRTVKPVSVTAAGQRTCSPKVRVQTLWFNYCSSWLGRGTEIRFLSKNLKSIFTLKHRPNWLQ